MKRSTRLAIATLPAAFVSFGVFLAVQRLVSADAPELRDGPRATGIEIVRLERDESEVAHRELRPKRPPPPQQQAPPPQPRVAPLPRAGELALEVARPEMVAPVLSGRPLSASLATMDGDVVPLVRIEPEFPRRARLRNLEGWVLIEFTIGPAGTVQDPVVVKADPPGIFDRSALDAVRRWRYRPRVVDGKPVPRPGVQVRMRFVLEDR